MKVERTKEGHRTASASRFSLEAAGRGLRGGGAPPPPTTRHRTAPPVLLPNCSATLTFTQGLLLRRLGELSERAKRLVVPPRPWVVRQLSRNPVLQPPEPP